MAIEKETFVVTHKAKAVQHRRILVMAAVLCIVFLLSFMIGRYPVPLPDVIKILGSRILHLPFAVTWDAQMEIALCNIRLPRILLACLVGAALSAAGGTGLCSSNI